MARAKPAPTQTRDQEDFVSPTREPEPMSDKDLAKAALEVFESDLEDPEAVRAEVNGMDEGEQQVREMEANALEQMPHGGQGLHAKLAEVMAVVGRIPKNGTAPAAMGGYPFVQVGDAADVIRRELGSRGVSMLPETTRIVDLQTGGGSKGFTTTMTVETTWRLTDGDTGETATIQSLGTGADNGDKFSPKAQTNAMKYALLMGFLLSTGDDPEAADLSEPAQGPGITINASNIQGVKQGGRQNQATAPQLDAIRQQARRLDLSPESFAILIGAALGGKSPEIDDKESISAQQAAILDFCASLDWAEAGALVRSLQDTADPE